MERERYDRLRKAYAGFASWAIWNPDERRDTAIIENCVEELHARAVMVGLNISAPLTVPWSNFHIGRNDGKLASAFNQGPYRGAYMTDLIKGEVEVSSATLMRRIRTEQIDLSRHIADFKTETKLIGATRESLFVLFGGDVSRLSRNI